MLLNNSFINSLISYIISYILFHKYFQCESFMEKIVALFLSIKFKIIFNNNNKMKHRFNNALK